MISDKNSAEPKAMPSADNSCHVGFAICIDKLTKRLNLTKENISNCIDTYVLIKISFVVTFELYDNLIGSWIQHDVTNGGRFECVGFEEHDDWVDKVCTKSKTQTANAGTWNDWMQSTRLTPTMFAFTQKPSDMLGWLMRLMIARRDTLT